MTSVVNGSAYLYCTGIPSKLEIYFLLLFIYIVVSLDILAVQTKPHSISVLCSFICIYAHPMFDVLFVRITYFKVSSHCLPLIRGRVAGTAAQAMFFCNCFFVIFVSVQFCNNTKNVFFMSRL